MELTITSASKTSKAQAASQSNWQRIILLIVLGYEAAGGLLGGALLIAAPDGHLMHMPTFIMHGAFRDFLIPGIILTGLGILSAFSFISLLRRLSIDWFTAGMALGGWSVWFVVEIIVLQGLHWLHLMWGVPVLLGWIMLIPLIALRKPTAMMLNTLLICGILSSLWYVAINIYIPMQYEGYSLSSLTVSELSAIGAPTRLQWVLLVLPYPLLLGAFGWGIVQVAGNRALRFVGGLIVAYCVFNLYWPPMHMRGLEPTITDALHIIWASITVLMMIAMLGFGAAAFGKSFRAYTLTSLALLIIFGVLTSLQAPNIPKNGPTPHIGVLERINIGVFLLWVAVLAIILLRRTRQTDDSKKKLVK